MVVTKAASNGSRIDPTFPLTIQSWNCHNMSATEDTSVFLMYMPWNRLPYHIPRNCPRHWNCRIRNLQRKCGSPHDDSPSSSMPRLAIWALTGDCRSPALTGWSALSCIPFRRAVHTSIRTLVSGRAWRYRHLHLPVWIALYAKPITDSTCIMHRSQYFFSKYLCFYPSFPGK